MNKFICAVIASVALAAEPNPPNWQTDKVFVFQPNDGSAQATIDRVLAQNGGHIPAWNGQWSEGRYAFLFAPGQHNLNVEIGYYTTVHGLGRTPDQVTLGNLMCQNGDFDFTGGALANFWRSAENVRTVPAQGSMVWAVSQASPLRRIQVDGNLDLFQYNYGGAAGYASGGFMADMQISGKVTPGSQQQWFSRNANIGSGDGGVWNMVWVGCPNAPASHCSNAGGKTPASTVDEAPVVVEKPYLVMDGTQFKLMRPKAEWNKVGHTYGWQNSDEIDFSQVYVANDSDSAATINAKLAEGLHLVLQPGIYHLEDSIKVNNANTVVLGMGMATLIPDNGTAAIEVANVEGVRIAGVLLEAGFGASDSLLIYGQPGYAGNASNPGSINDVFARVGGTNPEGTNTRTNKMLTINTGHTVIDDVWNWRADHSSTGLVYNSQNPVDTGLMVNGDNVVGYGLACEHTLGDMLVWNGENGKSFFYQSEFPYDVTQANYGDKGYVAYRVAENVTKHEAYGVGAYTFFRDNSVIVQNGISAPDRAGVAFHNSLNVFLNGYGECSHVINGQGGAARSGNGQNWVCEYGSTGADLFLH